MHRPDVEKERIKQFYDEVVGLLRTHNQDAVRIPVLRLYLVKTATEANLHQLKYLFNILLKLVNGNIIPAR